MKIQTFAENVEPKFLLVYDHLYGYAERTSDVFPLYIKIKCNHEQVSMLQVGDLDIEKIEQNTLVILVASSFDSEEKYVETMNDLKDQNYDVYDESSFYLKKSSEEGLFIGIDEVYPFSDLNKLMDMADKLNSKGVKFVCTVMPVYDNVQMEAYDKFIEVLKYVEKMGGTLFIHYPIHNTHGTYNPDKKAALEKATEEYRRQGLEITGVTFPLDQLFMNAEAFQNLDFDFILVEEAIGKVDVDLDFFNITKQISPYIYLNKFDTSNLNLFTYKQGYKFPPDLIACSLDDDIEELDHLLNALYSEKILVKSFKTSSFNERILKIKDSRILNTSTAVDNKTQLDIFQEEQMKRIRGENLSPEEKPSEGYDISHIVGIGSKIALTIIFIFGILLFIGRRVDSKKYFKE